jgi:hypothetical protein
LDLHRAYAALLLIHIIIIIIIIIMMKLQFLLCLCSLASSVLASQGAGPYQTVFVWYAYRLEVLQYGPLSTLTGTGCVGTVPGGGCYFDEFIRWIQRTGRKSQAWTGSTGIGTNLTPDTEDAVTKLIVEGYPSNIDPSKLLPHTYVSGKPPSLTAMFNVVMENIAATRQAMKVAGTDETHSVELEEMRRAMIGTTEARRAEQFGTQIDEFVALCQKNKCTFNIITKMHTAPDGERYPELDTDKMIASSPGQANEIKTAMAAYAAQGAGKRMGDAVHLKTIQSCTSWESELLAPPPCE